MASSPDSTTSLLNECFTVAWGVACKDGAVDSAFWAHVRLLAEQCRTDEDWQSLLSVLLEISLSELPPPADREPIYRWSVGRLPSTGLRASRPRRKRADGPTAAAAAASGETPGVKTSGVGGKSATSQISAVRMTTCASGTKTPRRRKPR